MSRGTVLVTGGTGSVGINIVRRLAHDGWLVQCVARRADQVDAARDRFLAPVRDQVVFITGNVGSPEFADAIWKEHRPSHIVHAAAITPTQETERSDGARILETNIMGTVHVLEGAWRARVRRVVYVSSAAVYGQTDEGKAITEDTPLNPQGLYAIAKDACEKLCAYYQALHGLETVALRVGWVYGPMERPMPHSRTHVSLVYEWTRLALAGEEIRMLHLDPVRDWIHADDLARAVGVLLGQDRLGSPLYNLSGGRGYHHREALDTLNRIVPLRYRQVGDPAEANVPPTLSRSRRGPTSSTRLLEESSYRSQFNLEEGLRDYVKWLREDQA